MVARQLFDHDLAHQRELVFFASVQKKFYVDGLDPSDADFYRDICDEFGLEFGSFRSAFASAEARQAVVADFRLTRQRGVRGFPSVVVDVAVQTHPVSAGYVSFPELESRLRAVMLD